LSVSRLLLRAAAASFAFALSAHSQAYCLTYTCDANKEVCPEDSQTGCNVGGKPLFWSSSVVSFSVQKDGSKRQNISADQLHTVVVEAFKRWLNATCSDGNGPSISIADFGKVECAKPEYNKDQGNQNVITFHDAVWPYKNTGAETLALTTVFFSPETGEIYDANIEINSYQPDDQPPRFVIGEAEADSDHDDLNAVLTHEIGHFLGLSHSRVQEATMYQSYEVGMASLEADDMAAICASLPPNRTPGPLGSPPGVPRHGYSTECGEAENGCCASTIGGNTPSSGPLALWAFGLGLVAWCGRFRVRHAQGATRSARALPR
jgi:hypothetical protein